MQSDTLIGIAGAVVLVAVMVGVFAYEYNNAPVDDDDDGAGDGDQQERLEAFHAAYPNLNATQDIDGDGTPNWEDDDLDGDGADNAQDDAVCVCDRSFSGSVAQRTVTNDPEATHEFFVGQGATGGQVLVEWDPGAGNAANLVVTVDGPESVPCSSGQGSATCDLRGLGTGTYTIHVRHAQQIAQANSFEGTFSVEY